MKVVHKSWYQLQCRSANQPAFLDYDAPIPAGAVFTFETALANYREAAVRDPGSEWRLIVRSETTVISTEPIDGKRETRRRLYAD